MHHGMFKHSAFIKSFNYKNNQIAVFILILNMEADTQRALVFCSRLNGKKVCKLDCRSRCVSFLGLL